MKTTTTEKFHTNCPNCGGVIGPTDKFCTYCGTGVVYERTVTHESESGAEIPQPKVNISNKTASTIACAVGIFFLVDWVFVAFGIMMTFGLGVGGMVGIGGFGYEFGILGFAAIIPFLFGCAGIVGIIFLIKKIIEINKVEKDK